MAVLYRLGGDLSICGVVRLVGGRHRLPCPDGARRLAAMYRLLATDIDDTILAPDGSLPEANHRALQALHARGITVVLSSGRATVSMRPVAARIIDLADDEYLISYNGGRVVTALSDTEIYRKALDHAIVSEIAQYCREHELLVHGYSDTGFLAQHSGASHGAESVRYAEGTRMVWEPVDDLAAALPDGSIKLLIIERDRDLEPHREALNAMAQGRYVAMYSKPEYLEIVAAGVSKGDALTMLAARLGISMSETLAVGDSLNDREMVMAAGLGVAVANARAELKAVADVVLERSAADGAIAELAERFFPEA